MAWAMEPQLGFQELALLFQHLGRRALLLLISRLVDWRCLGGKDGRIAPVDFCRAFQAVDAGVPASSTQGSQALILLLFNPSRVEGSFSIRHSPKLTQDVVIWEEGRR